MFLALSEVERSLTRLGTVHPFFGVSFLAFKRLGLRVGGLQIDIPIAQEERALLDRYYSPAPNYDGYYIPFRGGGRRERWVNSRYPDTTLQRIRTDTFKDALMHAKKTASWGWKLNYVKALKRHLRAPLPALDLAVWLYRDVEFPNGAVAADLVKRLTDDFVLTPDETSLFARPNGRELSWSEQATAWADLRQIIGLPPGAPAEEGASLGYLALHGIGPGGSVSMAPGDRLTIVTGDNGLGKSFLLECAWYALTGTWSATPAQPINGRQVSEATIQYKLGTVHGPGETHVARYNWPTQTWTQTTERRVIPGVIFFARADGSFAIWDPTKQSELRSGSYCSLNREEAWDGKRTTGGSGRSQVICGGLLADWSLWQSSPDRYPYEPFCAAVRRLSPPEIRPPVEPGPPTRIPGDVRDVPTLRHPYGDVPIVFASAGIQRIVTIAYLLVWTWYEHVRASELAKRTPQERLVVLIDEIEAHLHPRWQRTIVPALLDTIRLISSEVQVQIVIATHAPLVLASIETDFDPDVDKLFHLELDARTVMLEEMPFVKYGDADNWLRSELFGLRHARSVEAEGAIEAAKAVQLDDAPAADRIAAVHARLEQVLSASDDFWPRWRYFARKHGLSA